MAPLIFNDVHLSFGNQIVLSRFNFALEPNQIVAIVGPSGSGKTSILRLAAKLLEPTSGTVVLDDEIRVSYVFQAPNLLPWRTAKENVSLPLEIQTFSHNEREQLAHESLMKVGLLDHAHKLPHQLSGGMQMRCSIARAIATKPDVLLLDEPFSALDEITRSSILHMLSVLVSTEKMSAFFVSHSLSEATFFADSILVLNGSRYEVVKSLETPRPRSIESLYSVENAKISSEVLAKFRLAQ